MTKFTRFFQSILEEGRKVIWPTRNTVLQHSIMVMAVVVVSTLIIAGLDYVLQNLLLLALNRA